jgi:hypothetical protein
LTSNRVLAVTLVSILVPGAAHAQGVEGTRSATIFVGTGISLAGDAIKEGVGTIDGKPSVIVEQAVSNHFSDGLKGASGESDPNVRSAIDVASVRAARTTTR